MWQFAIPILFMEIWDDTLLPSAVFTFASYLAVFFFMPHVGAWVDQTPRITVMRTSILIQNIAILFSSCMMFALIFVTTGGTAAINSDNSPEWTWKMYASFGSIVAASVVGELMGNAGTLALERDWIVVISEKNSIALSAMNSTMRRIDLCSKLLAPLAFGLALQFLGKDDVHRLQLGTLIVAGWNLLSLPIEYHTIHVVYEQHKQILGTKDVDLNRATETPLQQMVTGWHMYTNHRVFWASFSYCMIYMTVLDNGVLMTAYLKWTGVPDGLLGGSRGLGAFLGIVGTYVYPVFYQCIGSLPKTGSSSLWMFWLFILPAGVSFFLDRFTSFEMTYNGVLVTPYIMIGSVALSRIWLWAFDLAECQILQEMVEEQSRGTINAVQAATYQLFWVLLSVQGMVFSDPADFYVLALISVLTVFCAAIIFSTWAGSNAAQAVSSNNAHASQRMQRTIGSLESSVSQLRADFVDLQSNVDARLSRLERACNMNTDGAS
jgi:iron-regulated transporter 1